MNETINESSPDPDVFRILITNDNHVGFKEDDKIRKRDALATFEEILQIARSMKVDFLLHSGDLFDDARPNRYWMNSVMRLFREYCFGDNGVAFHQIKTDFSKPANFEDPNMNIDLPVFMIHGNHDDAGGEFGDSRALSCADVLETANLLTYFGQHDNVEEEIQIAPILLKKGATGLALYGLGNIRDDRLHRMFISKKVSFMAPPEGYFNLMSIHQNRFRGNAGGAPSKNCIHPTFLPSFLNLVVWAHEHECIPSPEESIEAGFHILQSGSSVATSLTGSEKMAKHVFLLEIKNGQFRSTPIPLLSVRPLLVEEARADSDIGSTVNEMIKRGNMESKLQIELLSKKFENKTWLFPSIRPELPLVRLRLSPGANDSIDLGSHVMNQKFGRQFVDRVANPDEILQVIKSKRLGSSRRKSEGVVQLELEDEGEEKENVQDLIFNYMGGTKGETLLDVLVEPDFNVAVQDYVHKSDAQAIDRFVKAQLDLIAKAALASDAADVSAIGEVVKKRALVARNDCLNRVLEQQPPMDVVEDDIDPPSISKQVRLKESIKRDRESDDEDFFDDIIFPHKKLQQKKSTSIPLNQMAATTTTLLTSPPMASSFAPSVNPMVAAMMGSSQGSQWVRRM